MNEYFDFKYFLKGAVSGATGLLLSHPIDTIKSNVQENKKIRWNIRYLFRGVWPPFFGMGMEKAIVFGTYQNVYRALDKKNSDIYNRTVSGISAGFMGSFIVTPVERLKILYQTNSNIKHKINLRHLFRGFPNTLSREMPGFAIYFNVYEELKSLTPQTTIIHHFIYGGLSGMLSWAFIYPQDLVKTQIQASNDKTVTEIVKNIYKNNGVKGFFRGFHLALFRAVPLHAGTFAMFEHLNKCSS